MEVRPQPRGEGFEFVDKIVGGAIPRNFIPAVEKGVRAAMDEGVLAGYPVVDVRSSSTTASTTPSTRPTWPSRSPGPSASRRPCEKAQPVLLEPIMNVEVIVPEENVGDIIGDLNSRRGRVLGRTPRGHYNVVGAEVPLAEMLSYAPDLTSMTGGRGDYHMEFLRYEEVPGAPHAEDRRAGQEGARKRRRRADATPSAFPREGGRSCAALRGIGRLGAAVESVAASNGGSP